ncbi:MAG TPA: hypothetical protein GYA10_02155 [Alphaproteobacteria bacterium]|nr:hypothetical protein [Alphaproteobacteria bacterium]
MLDRPPGPGHNNGPPLDDAPRPWGAGGIGNYFEWKAATEAAFRKVPAPIAIRRARLAEALGLTYFEYQLEILERGRYLQATDTERIREIKRRRPLRY